MLFRKRHDMPDLRNLAQLAPFSSFPTMVCKVCSKNEWVFFKLQWHTFTGFYLLFEQLWWDCRCSHDFWSHSRWPVGKIPYSIYAVTRWQMRWKQQYGRTRVRQTENALKQWQLTPASCYKVNSVGQSNPTQLVLRKRDSGVFVWVLEGLKHVPPRGGFSE